MIGTKTADLTSDIVRRTELKWTGTILTLGAYLRPIKTISPIHSPIITSTTILRPATALPIPITSLTLPAALTAVLTVLGIRTPRSQLIISGRPLRLLETRQPLILE